MHVIIGLPKTEQGSAVAGVLAKVPYYCIYCIVKYFLGSFLFRSLICLATAKDLAKSFVQPQLRRYRVDICLSTSCPGRYLVFCFRREAQSGVPDIMR